jgi:hypothetical protein
MERGSAAATGEHVAAEIWEGTPASIAAMAGSLTNPEAVR